MTASPRFERDLSARLTDLAAERRPDYLDDAFYGRVAATRQRPSWVFPERWLPMDLSTSRAPVVRVPWRQLGLVALLAILLAAAIAVVGSRSTPTPAPVFGLADNGLISYAKDGDLYVGDPLTGESRLLLGGETADIEPAFSRDGTRIAFLRLVDPADPDVFRIWAMDADGSDAHVVTPDPIADPSWWDWTPRGDVVVAARTDAAIDDLTIYDGGGVDAPKRLTEGIDVDAPVFRPPDSQEIMFRGQVGNDVAIYVMNADGSNLHELVPSMPIGIDVNLQEPRYSPDGSRIAYHQWDDATDTVRLFVMDADGTNRRELGARDGIWFTGWPVWSNDGTRIASAHVLRDASLPGPYAVIDVATDTIVQTGPDSAEARIEWAPDDSSILMSRNDGSAQFLLDPDGGPAVELPWGAASYPSWQRLAP